MSPLFVGSGSSGSEGRSDRLGLPTGTSDPGTAEAGDLYYKTDTNKIRYYDGSVWADLASGGGGGGAAAYTIDSSVRFDDASSSYLSRTFSAGNRKTWTLSFWIKFTGKPSTSGQTNIFGVTGGDVFTTHRLFTDSSSSTLVFESASATVKLETQQVFRDYSAWYHIVLAFDTTQATSSNRQKLYVNGVEALLATNLAPNQNTDYAVNGAVEHQLGRINFSPARYSNIYLADVHFIDGSALAPTAFGEFDATTGVWNPIEYTGTYPGNSFHLDFADNSTAAALGTDTSGAGNDWDVYNIFPAALAGNWASQLSANNSGNSISNPSDAFDGSTSTYAGLNLEVGGTRGLVWTPATTVTVSSSLRVYWRSWTSTTYNSGYVYVNGINQGQVASNLNGWHTVNFTGTITTLELRSVYNSGGGHHIDLAAIEVDGQIIRDVLPSEIDSLVDSPTNYGTDTGAGGQVRGNYCTWNPLHANNVLVNGYSTLSNGNLTASAPSNGNDETSGTIGVSSDKWYFELTNESGGANTDGIGIADLSAGIEVIYRDDGAFRYNGSESAFGASWQTVGDIIGVAIDLDNTTIAFYKNGVSQGNAKTDLPTGTYHPFVYNRAGAPAVSTLTANFGQRPFAYTAPSGFKALCTANLPTPAVENPVDVVGALIWTGTATGGNRTIGPDTSYMNFIPDLVWSKSYNGNTYHNQMYDVLRGFTSAAGGVGALITDQTFAEGGAVGGYISAVGDGTITYSPEGSGSGYEWYDQNSSHDYIARCWNAGTTTVTGYQPSGATVACNYRANTDAGFSIISYTGPSGTSDHYVGHGLLKAPEFIIVKNRDTTFNWDIYHQGLADTESFVFSNAAQRTVVAFRNQDPTSLLIPLRNDFTTKAGNAYIAYAWHSVDGLSSFGTYTGTGSSDGPYYHCGFRPQLIVVKGAASSSQWFIHDDTRVPERTDGNPSTKEMAWESTQVQYDTVGVGAGERLDILANGFKIRTANGACNASGVKYCVMAWARSPFKYARAR